MIRNRKWFAVLLSALIVLSTGCAMRVGPGTTRAASSAGGEKVSPKWSLTIVLLLVFHLISLVLIAATMDRNAVVFVFPFGELDLSGLNGVGFAELALGAVLSIVLVWKTRWED